jgi:hypothetical protein
VAKQIEASGASPVQPQPAAAPAAAPAPASAVGPNQLAAETSSAEVGETLNALDSIADPTQRLVANLASRDQILADTASSAGREADQLTAINTDLNKAYDKGQAKAETAISRLEAENAENQVRENEAEANKDRDYKIMMEPDKELPSWKKVMSGIVTVFGALGAASGTPDAAAFAAAMKLIDGKLQEEIILQAKTKLAAKTRTEASDSRLDQNNDDNEANISQVTGLTTAAYRLAADHALEAAGKAKTSTEAETLKRAGLNLQIKALDYQADGAKAAQEAAQRALENKQRQQSLGLQAQGQAQSREAAERKWAWDHMDIVEKKRLAAAGDMEAQKDIAELDFNRKRSVVAAPAPMFDIVRPEIYNQISGEAAEKFRDGVSAVQVYREASNELEGLLKEYGNERLPSISPVAARMETLKQVIVGKVKEAMSLGALDNGVDSFGNKMVGNPNDWFSWNNLEKAKTARRMFERELIVRGTNIGLKANIPWGDDEEKKAKVSDVRSKYPSGFNASPVVDTHTADPTEEEMFDVLSKVKVR